MVEAPPVSHMAVAEPARIHRDYEAQRRHLPRIESSARALALAAASEPDALRLVDERLAGLRSALWGSPFYTEVLREAGLHPSDLGGVRDLRWFPMVDRAALGARWQDLPSVDLGAPDARELVAVRSSGSTGEPITVVKDGYDCVHMWAVLRFWAERLGIAPIRWEAPRTLRQKWVAGARCRTGAGSGSGDPRHIMQQRSPGPEPAGSGSGRSDSFLTERPRVVLLCALPGGLEYEARLPLLHDGTLTRISTVRPAPLERLRAVRPDVLFSDPAGLHWLAAQERPPLPRLALTSAQRFSPAQRQELARALPCPVINYYATTEVGPIAWECLVEAGRFHVLLPDVWVEAVDGELVVTRLRESALPILRYRTGDRGRVTDGVCSCGARGPSIEGFTGRRACSFVTPSGGAVDAWKLAFLFKYVPLADFRFTQRTVRSFQLEVVSGDRVETERLRGRLLEALRIEGWEKAEIRIDRVDAIEGRGTKPEPFRSLVGQGD